MLELIVEQARRIRFESESRMVATPISGVRRYSGVEVVWEGVG
jgi:hypothetical protein